MVMVSGGSTWMNPSTLMDFLLGFMDLENISYIFNVQVLACGAPESLLSGYSSLRALAFWLQVQMLYHWATGDSWEFRSLN